MRYRISGNETRLGGNSNPVLLNNEPSNTPFDAMAMQAFIALGLVWPELEGCDFSIQDNQDRLCLGTEPSYFGDNLKIIEIHRTKEESCFITGRAFGMYGSGIRKKTKRYSEFRRACKFTRFVDEFHPKLYPTK